MSILKKIKPHLLLNPILTILIFQTCSISAFADISDGLGNTFFYGAEIAETDTLYLDSLQLAANRNIGFGVKAGINRSNMNFNKGYHSDTDYVNPVWKSGYFAGAAIQIPLPRRFSLTQEYLLSRTRGQYTPAESIYTLDYLSIPLLLGYSFHKNFLIMTGPQFELLILGKEDSGGQVKNITKMTEERSIGWVLGLQYAVLPQFFLDARFMHGINAIGINQRHNRSEFQYEVFQISTNYIFK